MKNGYFWPIAGKKKQTTIEKNKEFETWGLLCVVYTEVFMRPTALTSVHA
jgi:hypothetical protein